jgi:hypothetical protein
LSVEKVASKGRLLLLRCREFEGEGRRIFAMVYEGLVRRAVKAGMRIVAEDYM